MKQRTFTQRWNATALRRIKKQLLASRSDYLCVTSLEFQELWTEHKQEIRKLAELSNQPHVQTSSPYGDCLFYSNGELDRPTWLTIRKQVRIDFLNHEIKRLTSK